MDGLLCCEALLFFIFRGHRLLKCSFILFEYKYPVGFVSFGDLPSLSTLATRNHIPNFQQLTYKMEAVASPDTMEGMRVPPAVPVERVDADISTSPTHTSLCRTYYTPTPTPLAVNPGPPPSLPPAPRLLPLRKKGESTTYRNSLRRHHNLNVERYNEALAKFNDENEAWESDYKEYLRLLKISELPLIEEGKNDEEEDNGSPKDLIAAAEPI
jgi:hypothetical protein